MLGVGVISLYVVVCFVSSNSIWNGNVMSLIFDVWYIFFFHEKVKYKLFWFRKRNSDLNNIVV